MRPNKRDELVRKALQVFYRDGFHATGMDKLVVETGVSKTSMYKHFRTKDDLILAALKLQDERFRDDLFSRISAMSDSPAGQLLASFDALGDWVQQKEFRGCTFIKAGAEFQEKDHPIHKQSAAHKQIMLDHFTNLAREAGAPAPERLACQLLLLQEGAIVTAVFLKSCEPAREAKAAAQLLLDAALS